MKKCIVINSGIGIFLLAAMVLCWILIMDKVPTDIFSFLDIGTYRIPNSAVEVNSSNVYGQSFVPNFDNLFMMSVFIPKQNLNLNNELFFHLKEKKDDKVDLVAFKWKFNQIRPALNNFYVVPPDREFTKAGFHFHFQFEPIVHSKGHEFYFYLESPSAAVGEGIRIGIWDNIKYYEALTSGQVYINGHAGQGFLAFRTYNMWKVDMCALLRQIKTRLLMDRPFLVFYSICLAVIILGIVIFSGENRG